MSWAAFANSIRTSKTIDLEPPLQNIKLFCSGSTCILAPPLTGGSAIGIRIASEYTKKDTLVIYIDAKNSISNRIKSINTDYFLYTKFNLRIFKHLSDKFALITPKILILDGLDYSALKEEYFLSSTLAKHSYTVIINNYKLVTCNAENWVKFKKNVHYNNELIGYQSELITKNSKTRFMISAANGLISDAYEVGSRQIINKTKTVGSMFELNGIKAKGFRNFLYEEYCQVRTKLAVP